MSVETPRKEYEAMQPLWKRCRHAYDGQDAVKAQTTEYLPLLSGHTSSQDERYQAYLMRAMFYNATGRTVDGLSGSLFQKEPVIVAPERLKSHFRDVTLTTVPLELFAFTLAQEVLKTGRYGVLIDMALPFASPERMRPYWVGYRAEDILSWRSERRGGDEVLTRVVLQEKIEQDDPKDPFVTVRVDQYRVLELTAGGVMVTLWRKNAETGKITRFDEAAEGPGLELTRRGESLPFIPFLFFGPHGVTSTVGKPPLLDLVDVNLSHYRTSADLEHGRHWTALPQPWVVGAVDQTLAIGSGVAWALEGEHARAGMLEFTGEGLRALETADAEKRRMMATLGAKLLEETPRTQEAARTVELRHAGEHATLRSVASVLEQGLTLLTQWHAWWAGTDGARPTDIETSVALDKDFLDRRLSPEMLRSLMLTWQAGGLSYQTFYRNLQGAELTDPERTVEEEQELIRAGRDQDFGVGAGL